MEANYERKEQPQKVEEKDKERDKTTPSVVDPMAKAKEVIRDAIITKGEGEKGVAKEPDDITAYSRSVHNIDSSLD